MSDVGKELVKKWNRMGNSENNYGSTNIGYAYKRCAKDFEAALPAIEAEIEAKLREPMECGHPKACAKVGPRCPMKHEHTEENCGIGCTLCAELSIIKAERDGFESDYMRLFRKYNTAMNELSAAKQRLAELEGIDQACDTANAHVLLLQADVDRLSVAKQPRDLGRLWELVSWLKSRSDGYKQTEHGQYNFGDGKMLAFNRAADELAAILKEMEGK